MVKLGRATDAESSPACYPDRMIHALPKAEDRPRLLTSLIPIPLAAVLAMLVLLFG